MGVVGDKFAAVCVAWRWMRHNVRIPVDAQDLNGISFRAGRCVIKRHDLIRADMVEVEHMVDLAFEEEGGCAVGLELKAIPEIGAFAIAVPVAMHEVGIAGEWVSRPALEQMAGIIKPVELGSEAAAYGNFIRW